MLRQELVRFPQARDRPVVKVCSFACRRLWVDRPRSRWRGCRTERTARARVFLEAENRLLREALGRMLNSQGGIEVIGSDSAGPFQSNDLLEGQVDVLWRICGGDLEEDLAIVGKAHSAAPGVPILVIGATLENEEFLQCVRAGISGFCGARHRQTMLWRPPGQCRRGSVSGNALHGAISLL